MHFLGSICSVISQATSHLYVNNHKHCERTKAIMLVSDSDGSDFGLVARIVIVSVISKDFKVVVKRKAASSSWEIEVFLAFSQAFFFRASGTFT